MHGRCCPTIFNSGKDRQPDPVPEHETVSYRLCHQSVVGKMGCPGAEVARFLGVTTSAVVLAAKTEEIKEVQKYL